MQTSEDKIIKALQFLCFLLLEAWICWSIFGFTHRPQNVDWLTLCSLYSNKWGLCAGFPLLAAPLYFFFARGLNFKLGQVCIGQLLSSLAFVIAWMPFPWVHFLHLPTVSGLIIRILVIFWLSFIFYWYILARHQPVSSLLRKLRNNLSLDRATI